MTDLEPFNPSRFVSKMLGFGDIQKIQDQIAGAELPNFDFSQEFTMRSLYDQFSGLLRMGPLHKVLENIPGMFSLLGDKKK